MSKRKTHEEFVNDVKNKSPNTIVISKYVGRTKNIDCKCAICDYNWTTKAMNLLQGSGCPKCGRHKSDATRRRTNDQFLEMLKKKNPDITPLEEYKRDSEPIMVKCNICGKIYKATPSNLLQGKGCKECTNIKMRHDRMKSHDSFLQELQQINKNIIPLEKYNGRSNKILCRCLLHNTEGYISPSKLLSNQTFCKECIKEKVKQRAKTNNEFIKELFDINPDLITLEDYKGARTKIKVECKKCGYIWEATPSYLLSGRAHCISCSRSYSLGEETITNILKENNINFIPHKTFENLVGVGNHKLSYDFYLYDYNILIEYQGQYHDGTAGNQTEKEYQIQIRHDKLKYDYAKQNNIFLLEIWYYQDIKQELYKLLNNIPVTITA